jgi:aspartate-semialdehyde dehydrogenase
VNPRLIASSPVSFRRVAIVGATGAVGRELLRCLEELEFPVDELRLLSSARSRGQTLRFRDQAIVVDELDEGSFAGCGLALFAASSDIARTFAPVAVRAGALVIDNSSEFRTHADVPLVVPEINPEAAFRHSGIIANPNCSTIIAITPLWPIHKVNKIRRAIVSTYQAASGAGAEAMDELLESTRAYLEGREYPPRVLPHPYAFNLFSHNSKVDPATLYNEEETKMMRETTKIFGDESIRVAATCVRVPVLRAHAEAITITCAAPLSAADARELMRGAPGIEFVDEPERNRFPMPVLASERFPILVGRVRQDLSDDTGHSVSLFVCGDQLLKGAALNAVQIAQLFLR